MALTNITNIRDAKKAMLDWAYYAFNISPTKVIWMNQEISSPVKPYITLHVISSGRDIGQVEERKTFNATLQRQETVYIGQKEMTLQVSVFSEPIKSLEEKDAHVMLEDALNFLRTDHIDNMFKAAGIAYVSNTGVIPQDSQIADRWEKRANADIIFRYVSKIEDDGTTNGSGDWIETINTISEDEGTLIIGE